MFENMPAGIHLLGTVGTLPDKAIRTGAPG